MMKIAIARAYSSISGINTCYFNFYSSNFIVKGGSLLPVESAIITGYIKVDSIHRLHCFKLAKSFCNEKYIIVLYIYTSFIVITVLVREGGYL